MLKKEKREIEAKLHAYELCGESPCEKCLLGHSVGLEKCMKEGCFDKWRYDEIFWEEANKHLNELCEQIF